MKVIIIGAQAAGMSFAAKLQRNIKDTQITIYEKSDYASFGTCGLPYYLANCFKEERHLFARTPKDIIESGINAKFSHQVVKVDEKKQEISIINLKTKELFIDTYDKLIIATGSISINPFADENSDSIFTLKDFHIAKKIKTKLQEGNIKKVAILGAGFIGLELLETFSNFKDIEIHLFDIKENITDNLFDNDFEEIIQEELKNHNIKLHLDTKINQVIDKDSKVEIEYDNKIQEFDILMVAIGFKPNTAFLDNIDFKKLDNGALLIDTEGKTNINNIYAMGDCASIYHKVLKKDLYIPLATVANKLARHSADKIAGKKSSFQGVLGSSCIKILNLEIAKTGITEKEAINNNIDYKCAFVKDYNHTFYYPEVHPLYMKIIISKKDNIILGAQILGKKDAMLRIHALSLAIETKLTADDLGMLDFAYAPPFNRTWEALNILGNVAKSKK